MVKRKFIIDLDGEKVEIEGYDPKKALIRYLMKKRRSMLMTKDKEKVEKMWEKVPSNASVSGARSEKNYKITWKRLGEGELAGAR
ncbi:MAG: hypothetical protein QXN78_03190, partial [Conexivisphaerales archaeon]